MRPVIAIVGRPNVGKSSLFNRLVGQPIAIVDPTPGVTRDRLLHSVDRDPWRFELIDTGGIGIVDEAKLEKDVYKQVERAIGTAERIIFLADGRDGVTHLDRDIAERLRPLGKRVILAVNKLDHEGLDAELYQFFALGLGDPIGISATQGTGIDALVERVCEGLDGALASNQPAPDPEEQSRIRLCIAGRRNVGKSSLTNALAHEERVIVADHPGTTRDAIDVHIDSEHGAFTLIDTAGLRKRNQIEQDLEFYAACRTERAIKRADVILLVLDAGDEIGMVDKRIAHFCVAEGKPTVLVINKWDLAEAGRGDGKVPTRDSYRTWLADRLPGLAFAPVVFTCALSGAHVQDALRLAAELDLEGRQRVPTAEVNRLLEAALTRRRPKKIGPAHTRFYYGTQVAVSPPTFVFFVNRTDWIETSYVRYLEGFLRDRLPCPRVPLRILFKSRESQFHEQLDEHRVVQGRTKAERSPSLVVPAASRVRGRRFRRRDAEPRPRRGRGDQTRGNQAKPGGNQAGTGQDADEA